MGISLNNLVNFLVPFRSIKRKKLLEVFSGTHTLAFFPWFIGTFLTHTHTHTHTRARTHTPTHTHGLELELGAQLRECFKFGNFGIIT